MDTIYTETENLISLDFNSAKDMIGGGADCFSFFEECGDYKIAIILLVILLVVLFMKYRKERRAMRQYRRENSRERSRENSRERR